MIIKFIIWFIILAVAGLLFYKSSGTMNPCKINILQYAFYIIILQTVIGAILTSFGFIGHYTYRLLENPEHSTQMGIAFSALLIILLPATILCLEKILKISSKDSYNAYLKEPTKCDNDTLYFGIISFASIICLALLVYFISQIGYIPLIKLFFHEEGFNFATERTRLSTMTIINGYVKNLFIIYAIPILSVITFSFALVTKKGKWMALGAILFVAAIIVKTYDFSKAPVVFFFAMLFFVYIYHSGGIKPKIFGGFVVFGAITLVLMYNLTGYSGTFFDIYNGILGRTFFTQFGTLCMHFELFSTYLMFLGGRSLYPTMLSILGMDPESHIRSARIVMEVYGSDKVYSGTAGVMNTVFMGEAYANWGILGCILSIIWVGIVLGIAFILFMKLKKTPITVAFFAIITQQLVGTIQGGFADFTYSSTFVMTFIGLFVLYYLPNITEYTMKKISDKKK